MNRSFQILIFLLLITACKEDGYKNSFTVISPDEETKVRVINKDGKLFYSINEQSVQIIKESRLGIELDTVVFSGDLEIVKVESRTIDTTYEMLLGKRKLNRNFANELTITIENPSNQSIDVIFRAYNDGVTFRYALSRGINSMVVKNELTEFHFPDNTNAWLQGYNTLGPVYEEEFEYKIPVGTISPLYQEDGWSFPALFNREDNWVLISESDLNENYTASHIRNDENSPIYKVTLPIMEKDTFRGAPYPEIVLPWTSPWRVIHIGTLKDIVESNLINHVASPSIVNNTNWIKAGKASWGWLYNSNSPRDLEALKEYIDLSHEMGWEYSLVDANWHELNKEDFQSLLDYAKVKEVGLFLWYNSGGPHNAIKGSFEFTEGPRDRMFNTAVRKEEFEKLRALGIKGIKVDFFGSDRQNLIQIYQGILEDAANYELLINFHGCTIPRGWQRTYPHMVTMEAVKGNERFKSPKNRGYEYRAPRQNAILPFTRNVIGSMDYTPLTFSQNGLRHITTHGHELALSVVFESGVQHFSDTYESYLSLPSIAMQFLKDVPASWDDTKLLDGYPGKDCLIARRKGKDWYIGGINGYFEPHEFHLDLSFLGEESYSATLITNHGQEMTDFEQLAFEYPDTQTMSVSLEADDGFVVILSKNN